MKGQEEAAAAAQQTRRVDVRGAPHSIIYSGTEIPRGFRPARATACSRLYCLSMWNVFVASENFSVSHTLAESRRGRIVELEG